MAGFGESAITRTSGQCLVEVVMSKAYMSFPPPPLSPEIGACCGLRIFILPTCRSKKRSLTPPPNVPGYSLPYYLLPKNCFWIRGPMRLSLQILPETRYKYHGNPWSASLLTYCGHPWEYVEGTSQHVT